MSEAKNPESAMERAKARFNAFKLKYPLLLAAVLSYACFEESGATSINSPLIRNLHVGPPAKAQSLTCTTPCPSQPMSFPIFSGLFRCRVT